VGRAEGIAFCEALGILVASSGVDSTLSVYSLGWGAESDAGKTESDAGKTESDAGNTESESEAGSAEGSGLGSPSPKLRLTLEYTLRGLPREDSRGPWRFPYHDPERFRFNEWRGTMVFQDHPPYHLVFGEHFTDTVHAIDVVRRKHMGYVGVPGGVPACLGVASRGPLVAVGCDDTDFGDEHSMMLFEEQEDGTWATRWAVTNPLGGGGGYHPRALRFTTDGTKLLVLDSTMWRVSHVSVADGSLLRHIIPRVRRPWDIQQFAGGLLVSSLDSGLLFARAHGDVCTVKPWRCEGADPASIKAPHTLALASTLGLLAVTSETGIHVFQTMDDATTAAALEAAHATWTAAANPQSRAVPDVAGPLAPHPREPGEAASFAWVNDVGLFTLKQAMMRGF